MGARLDYKQAVEAANAAYYQATQSVREFYQRRAQEAQRDHVYAGTKIEERYERDLADAAVACQQALDEARREFEAECAALEAVRLSAIQMATANRSRAHASARDQYQAALSAARAGYDEAEPPARENLIVALRQARFTLVEALRGPRLPHDLPVTLPPEAKP